MQPIHAMTEQGMNNFAEYLDALKASPTLAAPTALLTDGAAATLIAGDRKIGSPRFASKLEMRRAI